MKRLWIILFILSPCFRQFTEKSFKLIKKDEYSFTIIPNKKIIVNNNEVIYKSIDYKNQQIMFLDYNSEKIKIDFNEIKSIGVKRSIVRRGFEGAVSGFFIGGVVAFLLDKKHGSIWFFGGTNGTTIAGGLAGSLIGGVSGVFTGLLTNSYYNLDIGNNNWQIK